ncbi:hypothetical protein [Clostridium uliginosum]|uniref:Uncharacterized protein n=1 Tax=Clostridium uliginosum TaxID=119641 RepID=A0A1I1QNX5_9CLOT|nr:hypothetical protein [Clostridium uliginosum]SFD23811.1 hypothetical protein SAMN05421842_12620 [Clostridium uliginosum]
MSLFLGKIHYWLFNKILWFEILESEIINLANNEGLDIESLSKEISEKYGVKLPNKPLEEMIDTSNIHGWLQEKIHCAEGRMAAYTTKIVENNKNACSKIEKIFIDQGIKAAKEVKKDKGVFESAEDIFNSINDYILDGMPCDRVNEVITCNEDNVEWTRRICVHKDIWDREQGDVNYFYILRVLWMTAFVNEVNNDFQYIECENGLKVIKRK